MSFAPACSLDQLLNLPAIKVVLDQTSLGTPAPTMPTHVLQGVIDEISPVESADRMVESFCAAGTSVEYTRDRTGTHNGLVPALENNFDPWLRLRFDGIPASSGCTTDTVLSALLPPEN
ncbi:lipase family protein [Nocardia sp. NPDC046473]|uniref:lipase family protein n=1 Tax=Nocardia sp. NPDC046473 TaxID=3155733 RepID=UPI0033D50E9A